MRPTRHACLRESAIETSVLPVVKRNTFSLCKDVGLESFEPRVIVREGLAAHRIFDTPIDHVPKQSDTPELSLKFGIGFGMGIRTIGMTHVARYCVRTAERFGVVKDTLAFCNQAIGRVFPDLTIAFGKSAISLKLIARRTARLRNIHSTVAF